MKPKPTPGTRKPTAIEVERQRLITSLRKTLKWMEELGAPRSLLLDVMQEVIDSERADDTAKRRPK